MAHPYIDVGMRRWIYTYAKENHWRVAKWIELPELVQEGWYCYAKVVRAVPKLAKIRNPSKNNRRVFMGYLKKTFANRLHDIAKARGPEVNVSSLLSPLQEHDEWLAANGPAEGALADLTTVLGKAGLRELGKLARVLQSDAVEGEAYLKYRLSNGRGYRRETNIEYVCRLAGFDLRDKPKDETPNEYILFRLGLKHMSNCVDIIEVLGDHFGVKVTS